LKEEANLIERVIYFDSYRRERVIDPKCLLPFSLFVQAIGNLRKSFFLEDNRSGSNIWLCFTLQKRAIIVRHAESNNEENAKRFNRSAQELYRLNEAVNSCLA